MFKVNYRKTKIMCEIYSKLAIKKPEKTSMTSISCLLLLTLNRFQRVLWCFLYWLWISNYWLCNLLVFKGIVMQTEKALINDRLRVSKISWKLRIPTVVGNRATWDSFLRLIVNFFPHFHVPFFYIFLTPQNYKLSL